MIIATFTHAFGDGTADPIQETVFHVVNRTFQLVENRRDVFFDYRKTARKHAYPIHRF